MKNSRLVAGGVHPSCDCPAVPKAAGVSDEFQEGCLCLGRLRRCSDSLLILIWELAGRYLYGSDFVSAASITSSAGMWKV